MTTVEDLKTQIIVRDPETKRMYIVLDKDNEVIVETYFLSEDNSKGDLVGIPEEEKVEPGIGAGDPGDSGEGTGTLFHRLCKS